MQDMYPNLPGVLAQFKDGGLVLRNEINPPATESVLLLGTAIDGPTMEPVAVDASTVEVLFGKSVNSNGTLNGATLVKAFEQAYSAGCRDIRVMRISGEKAGLELNMNTLTKTVEKTDTKSFTADGSVGQVFEVTYNVIDEDANYVKVSINGNELLDNSGLTIDGNEIMVGGDTVLVDGDEVEITYIYEGTETSTPKLTFESLYAGELYNSVQVEIKNVTNNSGAITGKEVVITKPDSKKSQITEGNLKYTTGDYDTLFDLVRAINSDPLNNVVRVFTDRQYDNEVSGDLLKVSTSENLTGGNNGLGLSKNKLYEALGGKRNALGFLVKEGAYQIIENYSVDTVVPVGVYANDVLFDENDNFAYQLALACAVMSHRTKSTMGVIATSTPTQAGLSAIDTHVGELLVLSNNLNLNMKDRNGNEIKDTDGNSIDLGRYISIVAGPDVTFGSGRFGVYAENSAAAYAGMVSGLAVQSAPTNKNVPNALGLRYTYSNSQLNSLTGARYVTFKFKQANSVVAVTDSMTAAKPNSDYRRLSTYRVIKAAANEIRNVCEPFIGEPNDTAQRNSMSAAIDKRLGKLVEAGVLQGYNFQIVVTPVMQILGQAQIELTLVPPMELRQITTVISLQPGA